MLSQFVLQARVLNLAAPPTRPFWTPRDCWERCGRRELITTAAASASATDTLNHLVLLELSFRDAADARGVEVGFLRLNTAQAAKLHRDG